MSRIAVYEGFRGYGGFGLVDPTYAMRTVNAVMGRVNGGWWAVEAAAKANAPNDIDKYEAILETNLRPLQAALANPLMKAITERGELQPWIDTARQAFAVERQVAEAVGAANLFSYLDAAEGDLQQLEAYAAEGVQATSTDYVQVVKDASAQVVAENYVQAVAQGTIAVRADLEQSAAVKTVREASGLSIPADAVWLNAPAVASVATQSAAPTAAAVAVAATVSATAPKKASLASIGFPVAGLVLGGPLGAIVGVVLAALFGEKKS